MTTPKADPALQRGAALFHGLGDRNRLAIVRQLSAGERRVVDLTNTLGLAQGTVSGHLACLRDCGLVQSQPQGRASVFSLTLGVPVRDVLAAAERVLVATGEAVTDCPTAGGHR